MPSVKFSATKKNDVPARELLPDPRLFSTSVIAPKARRDRNEAAFLRKIDPKRTEKNAKAVAKIAAAAQKNVVCTVITGGAGGVVSGRGDRGGRGKSAGGRGAPGRGHASRGSTNEDDSRCGEQLEGCRVKRKFEGGWLEGTIMEFNEEENLYHVVFDDNEEVDLTFEQIQKILS
jgi:hypothetical protein